MKRKLFKIFEILSMCMIAFLPPSNSLPFQHNYCKTDSDCNQPNFYCYESRECVECTNCSFYNRQVSTITKCAKTKHQCGNCISGMEAVYNFDETFTCQPIFTQITTINSNSDQNPSTNNEENNNTLLYILICLPIIFISCLVIIFKHKIWIIFKRLLPLNYENCPVVNNNNNNNVLPTNPPPPYSEKSPLAPPEESPLIQRTTILNDDNQRTNPYHPPNWVSGGSLSNNSYAPATNQETPPAVAAIDENTQPSVWSPTTENSSDLINQPISFSNILTATNPPQHEHFEQPSNEHSNSESSNRNPQYNIQVYVNNTNMNNMQVINEI